MLEIERRTGLQRGQIFQICQIGFRLRVRSEKCLLVISVMKIRQFSLKWRYDIRIRRSIEISYNRKMRKNLTSVKCVWNWVITENYKKKNCLRNSIKKKATFLNKFRYWMKYYIQLRKTPQCNATEIGLMQNYNKIVWKIRLRKEVFFWIDSSIKWNYHIQLAEALKL